MPKIRIVEKDLTSASIPYTGQNILFMLDTGVQSLTLIEDESQIPSGAQKSAIIKEFLSYGAKVLVAPTYAVAKGYLSDRNQFDVKFLLVDEPTPSESVSSTDVTALTDALEIACKRKDVAVIYGKKTTSYSTEEESLLKANMTSSGDDAFVSSEYRKAKGKFVLPFYAKSLVCTDGESVAEAAMLSFLKMVADGNPEWLAFAGAKRGIVPCAESCDYLTEDDIDNLQPTSGTTSSIKIAMNPICQVNPWGIRIWGSRTALPLGIDTATEGLVAQSFANIRVLICDLKKAIYRAARECQFEPDNDILWVNFTSKINVILEEMKQSYGIAGYKWSKQETAERAKVKAILRIIPIEPVEDFDITLELADSIEVEE